MGGGTLFPYAGGFWAAFLLLDTSTETAVLLINLVDNAEQSKVSENMEKQQARKKNDMQLKHDNNHAVVLAYICSRALGFPDSITVCLRRTNVSLT